MTHRREFFLRATIAPAGLIATLTGCMTHAPFCVPGQCFNSLLSHLRALAGQLAAGIELLGPTFGLDPAQVAAVKAWLNLVVIETDDISQAIAAGTWQEKAGALIKALQDGIAAAPRSLPAAAQLTIGAISAAAAAFIAVAYPSPSGASSGPQTAAARPRSATPYTGTPAEIAAIVAQTKQLRAALK